MLSLGGKSWTACILILQGVRGGAGQMSFGFHMGQIVKALQTFISQEWRN